jgi:hypothetical protein
LRERLEQAGLVARAAVVTGPDQQLDPGRLALCIKQLEKIGFAIHDADHPGVGQVAGSRGTIAQPLAPLKALAFLPGRFRRARGARLRRGKGRAQHAQRQALAAHRQGRVQVQAARSRLGLISPDDP